MQILETARRYVIKSVFHHCNAQVGIIALCRNQTRAFQAFASAHLIYRRLRPGFESCLAQQDPASRLIGSRALRATMMNGRSAFIDSVNAKYRSGSEAAASVYPGPARTRLLGGRCALNQNLIREPAGRSAGAGQRHAPAVRASLFYTATIDL